MQASRHVGIQGRQACRFAGRHVCRYAGRQARI